MPQSTKSPSSRARAVLYAVPFIAVAILVALVIGAQSPSTGCGSSGNSGAPALDYEFVIQIETWGKLPNGTVASQFIFPPDNIGIPGGACASTQFRDYGMNGRYPIYTLPSDFQSQATSSDYSIVHVTSSVTRTYTLNDFFAVWGEPFGRNNTLGLTVPPSPNQSNKFPSDTWWGFWLRCTPTPLSGNWTSQPLSPNMQIALYYATNTYQC